MRLALRIMQRSQTPHSWCSVGSRAREERWLAGTGGAAPCEVALDAVADANEEPALGGCGSGVRVVRRVSQVPFTSGLRLLSRSPSPSICVAPRSS